MCRWLAYCGEPIRLESLLVLPDHSLVAQSRAAVESVYAVNGDGFGIGWYANPDEPGVFHDTRPAWNDRNLRSIAQHVRSPLFLSHVRTTTGSAVSRTNCHPFRHGRWSSSTTARSGGSRGSPRP